MKLLQMTLLASVLLRPDVSPVAVAGDDWPQFRGPGGQGDARGSVIPLTWSESENVAWIADLPGKGFSSPVVAGNRVWVTTAVEFKPTAEQEKEILKSSRLEPKDFVRRQVAGRVSLRVLCFDIRNGQRIYDVEVASVESPEAIHVGNSYASPTPVINGDRLFVHFGVNGTACLDADTGDVVWQRSIPVFYSVGVGSSPVVFEDLLILVCDGIDTQFVIAVDQQTGETAWKTHRPPMRGENGQHHKAYSTPLVVQHDGRDQLVVPGAQWIVSYEPLTGKENWRLDHGAGFSTIPRPVFGNGMVYVCTGYGQSELLAVRIDGRGDVTKSHVAWTAKRQIPKNSSPLLVDDLLFVISDTGIASCFDALTGKSLWQERIGGNHSASPVFANGHVFFTSHEGEITALRASAEGPVLITSRIDGELKASPAILQSSVLLRTSSKLLCIR